MIYPHAKECLLDILTKRAEKAVDLHIIETDFIREITEYLRNLENKLHGLGDETADNYTAFALFLGKACATFGRLDTIRRIKEGILHGT